MIAYKFLKPGRVGRFSRFQWPEPGVWIRGAHDVAACTRQDRAAHAPIRRVRATGTR